MQQFVQLSPKQVEKLTKIAADRAILNTREGDILEIALESAGISLPVASVSLQGDKLLVTKLPVEEAKVEEVKEAPETQEG